MNSLFAADTAEIHEECGVLGIWSPSPCHMAMQAYYALYSLQHRGQESCGIVVNDDGLFTDYRDVGLLNQVFTKSILDSFPHGSMAVGHVRYGTTGGSGRENSQPIVVNHIKAAWLLPTTAIWSTPWSSGESLKCRAPSSTPPATLRSYPM